MGERDHGYRALDRIRELEAALREAADWLDTDAGIVEQQLGRGGVAKSLRELQQRIARAALSDEGGIDGSG